MQDKIDSLAERLRLRLDWLTSQQTYSLLGCKAEKALVVSIDYSKPPSPEHEELFPGLDGEIFDLYNSMACFTTILYDIENKEMTCIDPFHANGLEKLLGLDSKTTSPQMIIVYEAPDIDDSLMDCKISDWFTRERLPLYKAQGTAKRRLCQDCFRVEVSTDSEIAHYCDQCRSHSHKEFNYFGWKDSDYYPELPLFNSIHEIELVTKRHKMKWLSYCGSIVDGIDKPSCAGKALHKIYHYGLIPPFHFNTYLCGVALTAAEELVLHHGFAWRLSNGVPYLIQPKTNKLLPVAGLLVDFGTPHLPPEHCILESLWNRWENIISNLMMQQP